MKKQNIIIIGIFIIFVFGFYLISCNDDEIILDTIVTQKEYITVKISGEVYREGEYRVPSYWTLKNLLDYVGVKDTADLSHLDLTILIEEGSCYIINCLESKKTESNSKWLPRRNLHFTEQRRNEHNCMEQQFYTSNI